MQVEFMPRCRWSSAPGSGGPHVHVNTRLCFAGWAEAQGAIGAEAQMQVEPRLGCRWSMGPGAGGAQAQVQVELMPRCRWSSGSGGALAKVQVELRPR